MNTLDLKVSISDQKLNELNKVASVASNYISETKRTGRATPEEIRENIRGLNPHIKEVPDWVLVLIKEYAHHSCYYFALAAAELLKKNDLICIYTDVDDLSLKIIIKNAGQKEEEYKMQRTGYLHYVVNTGRKVRRRLYDPYGLSSLEDLGKIYRLTFKALIIPASIIKERLITGGKELEEITRKEREIIVEESIIKAREAVIKLNNFYNQYRKIA